MDRAIAQPYPKLPSVASTVVKALALAGAVVLGALNLPPPLSPEQEELAQQLYIEFGGAVSLDDIRDIIANNPGLSADQYRLLVEYYRRYKKKPFKVAAIFGIGTNTKGNIAKIFFLTAGDLAHIRDHPDALQGLSDEQLLALIQQLLQEEPDKVVTNKAKHTVDYYYNDVDVDGHYITVDIRVSTSTPGRIISVFERY